MRLIIRHLFLFFLGIIHSIPLLSSIIENNNYKVSINDFGQIEYYIDKSDYKYDTIQFRKDKYAGIAFKDIVLIKSKFNELKFESTYKGIFYSIEYKDTNGIFSSDIFIKNTRSTIFIPTVDVKIHLGIDTYMDTYPKWQNTFFPTMLRCERTHMTSYFMTPKGKVMLVASPDPIASWNNEYECFSQEMNIQDHKIKQGAHRIYTSSYSLLHRLPLPIRHPQNLYALNEGEGKKIRLYFKPIKSTANIQREFYNLIKAPIFTAELYTLPENKEFQGRLYIDNINSIEVRTPRNEIDSLNLKQIAYNEYGWTYKPFSGTGEYVITAQNKQGKISEMRLFVRPSFEYYLAKARKEALRSKPTTTHHAECFYPLYTYFLSRKYIPNKLEDKRAEQVYDSIFSVLFNKELGEMRQGKYRIQDAATMAGILSDRFQVTKDENDLNNAVALVDFLIKCQGKDGGYYNPLHKIYYTSVIYIAKSIMEVMNEEKKLATTSKPWREKYESHKKSVIKAIDDLAKRGDDLQTEGQMTFEDGMISCSVTQMALAALKVNDKQKKELYKKQAIKLANTHKCLTQGIIPDSRMNGSTLRFWEYQYTVNLMHNGMNSPCGWSAWKFYGSWYLYLLTGEYKYMKEVINGLGSCLQLLDIKTGKLNFCFLTDPYIDTYQFTETPSGTRQPKLNRVILGEQYIPQISNWHYANPYAWRKTKFGIDNFVHEIYKCMTEIFIENAYIIEKKKGKLIGINCTLHENNGFFDVKYNNKLIKNVHVNLNGEYKLKMGNNVYTGSGNKWLIGCPNDLSNF